MEKTNVFVDMDGVLAVWDDSKSHMMYDEGFFLTMNAHQGNLSLVKHLLDDTQLEVFILSTLLLESDYIEAEKREWLDKYLPEIPDSNRIFVPEGMMKSDYINSISEEFAKQTNVLIDDYTVNLISWKDSGYIGIKMMNGRNGSNGLWLRNNPSSYLSYRANPRNNYYKIAKLLKASNA